MTGVLRLAIPSDGPLHETSLLFLRSCGLDVLRSNTRRYAADVPSLPGVTVHFQRGADIPEKVEERSADLGIVGHDHFLEARREGGETDVVLDKLGFGQSQLVFGVPDSWIDVVSLADVADLTVEFRDTGKDLRIATKFPRLVERFLLTSGITHFSLVHTSGTLEAAPAMGYADVVADISTTGTTLRENRLKTIHGGVVLSSEACLIGNRVETGSAAEKLSLATSFVERIEAHLRSLGYYTVTANMRGESAEGVGDYVLEHSSISGLTGPTISKVHTNDGQGWYAITVMVERVKLLRAVDQLRALGADSVTVSQPSYVFQSRSEAASRLTGEA